MARKTNAAVALALSAMLAFGTIPAPALAEMATEAGAATTAQGAAAEAATIDGEKQVAENQKDVPAASNGLGRATLTLSSSELPWSGLPAAVEATVTSVDGSELARGSDYELAYYAADGKELGSAPSAPGPYLVSARGVAGGAWVGETETASFKVVAPEAAELAAGRTEVSLAGYVGWAGRVSVPGTYRVTVSSDAKVDLAAYADAGLSEKVATADASGRLELTVAEGSSAWVTLSQPEGAAATATVELSERVEAPVPAAQPATSETPAIAEASAQVEPTPNLATESAQPAGITQDNGGVTLSTQEEHTYMSVYLGNSTRSDDQSEILYRDESYYPVYFGPNGSSGPQVTVALNSYETDGSMTYNSKTIRLTEGTDYTLERVLVDSSSGLYKCVVQGKGEYAQYTREGPFYRVVSSIDLEALTNDRLCGVGVGVLCGSYMGKFGKVYEGTGYRPTEARVRYPGSPFFPYVDFVYPGPNCMQGAGFWITINKEGQSQPVGSIDGPGTYTITLTAKNGSNYYGTVTLPALVVEPTLSIDIANADASYPALFTTRYGEGGPKQYYLSEGLNGLDTLSFFGLSYYGGTSIQSSTKVALVENVDYTVTRSEGDGSVTLLLEGIGQYSGTKTFTLYGMTRQQMFEAQSGYSTNPSSEKPVFLSDSGRLIVLPGTMGSLTMGLDYVVEGFQNEQGEKITTAALGDTVYVKTKGLGVYDGCSLNVKGIVQQAYDTVDLASEAVGVAVINGTAREERQPDGSGYGLFLLRGAEPNVAVSVYSRGVLLREGDGFTVTKSLSSDGKYMDVTTKATGDSPMVSGTKTTRVQLVDKYQLDPRTNYVVKGPNNHSYYQGMWESSPVRLTFDSRPFMPTIEPQTIYGEGSAYWNNRPEVRIASIIGPDGAVHEMIDGPGTYTLVIEGTGDWEGTQSIRVDVDSVSGDIYLDNCTLEVPEACEITGGQARPTVTVKHPETGTVYNAGVDYDVEYGSNTIAGKRGWVKVTAKEGNQNRLKGSKAASFMVSDGDTKMNFLAQASGYSVMLMEPNGSGYYKAWPEFLTTSKPNSNPNGRVFKVAAGGRVEPQVRVKRSDGTYLLESDYSVTYENNDSDGLATARIEGKGAYGWTILAHFHVAVVEPTVTPATTVRAGTDWAAVYDPAYYAAKNPDVANWARRADGNIDGDKLLRHFVDNGRKEGRASKATFELASYYNANADLRRAFGTDWARYYDHYRGNGQRENRACSGVGALRGAVTSRDGVDWSPVYEGNFYAQHNPDVATWATRRFSSGSVLDDAALLQHFVNCGAKEARASKSSFDLRSYFNANPDLRAAFGGSADWSKYCRHYATNGSREGRRCYGINQLQGTVTKLGGTDWSPVYDRAYYGQRNPDIVGWATRKCGSTTVLDDYAMLSHFVNNGRKEGRASKQSFELASYYNANADLRRAFGTDWARYYDHYRGNGQREGRRCAGVGQLQGAPVTAEGVNWSPVYDANYYAQRNADVAKWARRSFASGSVIDDAALLSHFVNSGTKEARASKQSFEVHAYRNKNADLARAFGSDWKSYYRHYAKFGVNEHRPCV